MKKVISIWLSVLLVLVLFVGILNPVSSDTGSGDSGATRSSSARGEWSSYKAYYNQTFTIDKGWAAENVSVAIFVQTLKQSSGSFKSAEVLQSKIDFLDGNQTNTGTTRRVLCELFTATWCGNCPAAVGAFDRLTRDSNYFPGKATLIELHGSGDHGNTIGSTRQSWYSISGIPTTVFDGLNSVVGGNGNPNSTNLDTSYRNAINARWQTQSIIDITTFGQKTNTDGWINASVELVSPTPLRDLKVQFFILEDLYPANNSGAFYRYTVQNALIAQDFIPPNHPPEIKNTIESFSILEDDTDSSSIKLNDAFEDVDLDELTIYSDRDDANKENIKVEIDDGGNVTFTPDSNWNGEEDITFYADDGVADPIGQTIKVSITSLNDPPIITDPLVDFTMLEDLPVNDKFDLTEVFDDIDIDPELNAEPQAALEYSYSGNTNIDITITNNKVSFDPIPDWNGEETITFRAKDSSNSYVTDDVMIKVTSENDPPKLVKQIPDAIMNEDEQLTGFLDLNEHFSDQDGDPLTYEYEKPEHFDIKLNYQDDSVFVTLTPEENYWGTEIITFKATDIPDTEPVTAELKVTVDPVNDAPILKSTDDWDIITSTTSIFNNIITIDQDNPTKIVVTAYDPADNDEISFSDDTTLFDIDPETGEIDFTPTNDDVGEYIVTITIDDEQTENNQDFAEFTFLILNINDPPEIPQIISPEDGKTYITGTEINLKAVCADPDLLIEDAEEYLSYIWTTNKSSEVLSYNAEEKVTLEPGHHELKLTVRDDAGEKSSTEISIIVDIDRQKDTDADGIPDYQDEDIDNDGIPNVWEVKYSLDPLDPSDAEKDSDNDDYSNLDEYLGDDRKPGGDDSSDPTRRTDSPKEIAQKDDGRSTTTFLGSGVLIIVVSIVIIIIIILVLFMVLAQRRNKEQEPTEIEEPSPQIAQTPMQPQAPETMGMAPTTQYPQQQYPQTRYPQQQMGQPYAQSQQQPYCGYPPEVQEPAGISAAPYMAEDSTMAPTSSAESGLPPVVDDTPLLPSKNEGQNEEPEITSAPAEESTEDTTKPTESSPSCPNCSEPIKEDWLICPNCKEMI